jgi:hypothetical protein
MLFLDDLPPTTWCISSSRNKQYSIEQSFEIDIGTYL